MRWRVTTPTGATFACLVFIIDAEIEVQLTTTSNELVCASRVRSLDDATVVVRRWLQMVLADGMSDRASKLRVDVVH